MKEEIKKFLQFNGTNVYFLSADGKWWIAVKPICEALGIDFESQRKNIQKDKFLKPSIAEKAVIAADGKLRKMLCMEEFFIYGWLLQIQSDNALLQEYKWECYGLLYNHFKGAITKREALLRQRELLKVEISQAEMAEQQHRQDSDAYKKLQELKGQIVDNTKGLKGLDDEIVNQMTLFET